ILAITMPIRVITMAISAITIPIRAITMRRSGRSRSADLRDHDGAIFAIEKYPISRAVLPRVEEAHGNILVYQRKNLESRAAIAAIQKEQAQLDAIHDRKV